MSAELLRRAAEKLRESALAATPGPWTAHEDGLVWPESVGDPVSGSSLIEDANFVALMHPPVALALADLLQVLSWMPSIAHPADMDAATRVARAVLREGGDPS